MKAFLAVASLAFLAAALGYPKPGNTITYLDNDGNLVTEDLDENVVSPYAVDINKQKFMLYTPSNKDKAFELKSGDSALLNKSPFDDSQLTKVLIHGWQNSYEAESMQLIKDAYLAKGKYNVIICDYKEYNAPYVSAVSNAKGIGKNIGEFLSFLIAQGLNIKNVHIIGHSLGAHISGYAAQAITPKVKVPRITGLDAAGPLFDSNAADSRLSSDDATYVDCIHTSTEFGMTNRCGTADLYPNGGDNQPACANQLIPGGCNHAESYRYYSKSITDNNAYPARSCKSEADAKSPQKAPTACAAGNSVLGEAAIDRTPAGVYFVGTK